MGQACKGMGKVKKQNLPDLQPQPTSWLGAITDKANDAYNYMAGKATTVGNKMADTAKSGRRGKKSAHGYGKEKWRRHAPLRRRKPVRRNPPSGRRRPYGNERRGCHVPVRARPAQTSSDTRRPRLTRPRRPHGGNQRGQA